ncbi:MAG: hypothetical protein A2Y12_13890 [Planctomycetes bacterium GWF2_42_9]|nr:MAG: hypothetical protein A2Y12_13890 [Planctomycetes bacterium GWF2_42_9]HAL44359.1 hypothetical protein [Phycisphaerales bacterium]
MEHNKYLGIYVASDKTTVVLAAKTAGKIEVFDYFWVTPETPAPQAEQESASKFSFADTAAKIATLCAEKHFVFSDVAVAIDCRLYRQQKLHSEFQEYRQIAQTIKFDAEEALAVDAAQTAIAFELVGKQLSGADVSAYAASAEMMTEIIKSLQHNKLDPVTVEPDGICLRRIIDDSANGAVIAAVSQTRCFMICPAGGENKSIVRSFLTSPSQNKTSLFTSQIMLTMSTLTAEGRVSAIKAYDTTNKLDLKTLGEQTSMTTDSLDITEKITLPATLESHDGESLELIIAAGATAAFAAKTDKVDFRADFMPYQGKKEAIEKTIKIVGVSAAAFFVVLGILLQLNYFSIGRDIKKIETKFKNEYIIAMPGARFTNSHDAAQRLTREINKIKAVNSGMLSASGEDSIMAKMTYLFEALNSIPPNVDIDIDKIAITTKTMNITGSTNLGGNLQLFGAFDKHPKLTRGSTSIEPKDGRDNFRLTIDMKQGSK